MNAWKPFVARISFFPAPSSSPPPSVLDLYRKMWRDEPDSFQKQTHAFAPAVASGRCDEFMYRCTVVPTRIDFNIMAEEKQETETTVSLIENPVELFNEFRRLFGILDKSPLAIDILRVALNLHFININESYEDANKVLLRTIPEEYGVKIKSEEDFIFRINKPRKSEKISTVRMNYITQWSVDRIEVSKIAISPSGVGIGIPPSPLSTCIASRVLIDNNNTPKDILPSNAQAELLREALEETSEVNKKIGLNIEGL